MSKHFFQSNYKPKFDFKQTINFIQSFDKILIDKICEKYSSQLVNFPLTRSIKTFEVTNLFPRNIIFDNANTDYLFSLNENPIDFFIQKSNDFHSIKSFVSKTSIFNRDSELTNTDSINKDVLFLYMFYSNISVLDTSFKRITNSCISLINEALIGCFEKLESKKINKINVKNTWDVFNKKSVDKEKFINEYIYKNNPTLFIGTPLESSNESNELQMSNVEHKKYCASFYVYVPRLNNKLRLFKIFPVEFDEIQEKDGQNFLIQFDLSNIYLYALDKVHIAEVVASSWPEDFIDFVKTNNIKIM